MYQELSLAEVTASLAGVAASTKPTGKIIKMEIGLEHPIVYDGTVEPAVVDNRDRQASAIITMDRETFVALAMGKTSGTVALMTGKLKISGDLSAALGFQALMEKAQKLYRDGASE